MISVNNFSKKYGDFLAVDDISFEVQKGEIFGFVGKNGAGKSTTIRAMLNMIFPTSGTLNISGLDCVSETKQLKQIVSYMPSEFGVYEGVTSIELLKFVAGFSGVSAFKIKHLSDYFELDLHKKISEMSLGNKKKVSIICALLKPCEVLILDEPTSGLDPLMQKKFFDMILKKKKKGVTVFLSSHNLSEVENYCDRVAIIKDGKIIDVVDMKTVKKSKTKQVSYINSNGESKAYDFDGDVNDLIENLHKLELSDIEIKTKTITEDFIKYYKEEQQ